MSAFERFDRVAQDLRFSLRSLRRSPGLTITIVGTLSIGIAVLTTFFGFVNSVLYKSLPYPDADRKVALWIGWTVKPSVLDDLMKSSKAFERLSMFEWDSGMLEVNGDAVNASGAVIDSGFFALAQPRVLMGALPSTHDIQVGAPVAVLSENLWRKQFASAPDVIGRLITFKGRQCRVVAVLDGNFTIPDWTELWTPVVGSTYDPAEHRNWGMARLAPGATREQAERDIRLLSSQYHAMDPVLYKGKQLVYLDTRMVTSRGIVGLVPQVRLLLVAAMVILLIASTNLALLMIARGARRRGEMVVRASLGASRWRLMRQQLVESVLLAAAAGVVGTFLSIWGIRLFLLALGSGRPGARMMGWVQWGVDWRVLAVGIGGSLVAVLIFGVWPARAGTRFDLADVLKSDAAHGFAGGDPTRSGHLPIVLQLVLSVVLFTAAASLASTYRSLSRADRGFEPRGLFEASVTADPRDTAADTYNRFQRSVRDGVNSAPGGRASLYGYFLSFNGEDLDRSVYLPGATKTVVGPTEWRADPMVISDNYFTVLGLRLLAGRTFNANDTRGAPPVAVVTRTFAMHAWGSTDVIGKTIVVGHPLERSAQDKKMIAGAPPPPTVLPTATVIGVAEDRRLSGVIGGRVGLIARPQVYVSERQAQMVSNAVIYVRSARELGAAQGSVMKALSQLGRRVPIDVRSVEQQVADETSTSRMLATILSIFALVSLGLALIGIYGIVAFSVQYRTREIGIRIALGAHAIDVIRVIVSGGAQLAAIGLGLGLLAAVGLMRFLSSFVIGTTMSQILAAVAASALFGLVVLGASFIPARRAAKMNPIDALRQN